MWLTAVLMLAVIAWAYGPTLREMLRQWQSQPDYSHGYLVAPIATYFLWSRRASFPWHERQPCWRGAVLLVLVVAFRVAAGMFYLVALDGWTLPLSLAAITWLLYGWKVLKWGLPSIVFLWFMVPIPYSAESWLRAPLQAIATRLGTAVLLALGQPAIAQGNVILLGEHSLFVEEACSGLRILVGILALAFAFVLFSSWRWWQKLFVLLATLPVAIIANVLRIVVTGLLFKNVSTAAGQQFSHDLAGFVMVPLAALLLWSCLMFLQRCFPPIEDSPPAGHVTTSWARVR
jgi:exosortase